MSSHTAPAAPAETHLPRFLQGAAWTSFVLNVIIIATGGAVRLTSSGLGCSEWPLCTPDSLVPTAETGLHGIIEFGNRTISGPLLLAAIIVLVLSARIRASRRDLWNLSIVVLALVIFQALVGAFVVWEELQAALVGFHYVVSLIIVCIAAVYLARMKLPNTPRTLAVPKPFWMLTHIMTLGMSVLIIMGIITTANGPHSGDDNVVRDGFDATLLSHLHAWPGYFTLALIVILLAWAFSRQLPPLPWLLTLFCLMVVQILVGIYQSRNGLPPFFVGVHMVLAALTAAAMTVTLTRMKQPVTPQA